MSAATKVQHCAKNMLFFANLGKNSRATLEYRQLKEKVVDMYRTEVPKEARGQGIAAKLCQEAFNYCKENNFRIVATCPYVSKYANETATQAEKALVVKSLGDTHVDSPS